MAEKLGAQIMGLGAFTKVVGDAGVTVARRSRSIPITTGNSYSASGALWAAADAMKRMGLVAADPVTKKVQGQDHGDRRQRLDRLGQRPPAGDGV
jgi:predicted amino acid dehydrogenase